MVKALQAFRTTTILTLAFALSVLQPAAAVLATNNGNNNGNNAGGGNQACEEGYELLAKYDLQGGSYVLDNGTPGEVTVDGDANGGTFTVTNDDKLVYAVIVKGSNESKVDSYPNGLTSGSFDNSTLVNNGGQTPAISNLQFCGADKPVVQPDPEVFVRVTFICVATQDGITLNTGEEANEGDYIFRIRNEGEVATAFTAGVGGQGMFEGDIAVDETRYYETTSPVAGVSVKTSPVANLYMGTASTNNVGCEYPEVPDPEVFVRITFICVATQDGITLNTGEEANEGDYIFRIRNERDTATDFQAVKANNLVFSGNIAGNATDYYSVDGPIAGVSVKTSPVANLYMGTASTNNVGCEYPEVPATEPKVTTKSTVCSDKDLSNGKAVVRVKNLKDVRNESVTYTVSLTGEDSVVREIAEGKAKKFVFNNLAAGDYTVTVAGTDGTNVITSLTVKDCPEEPEVVEPTITFSSGPCVGEGQTTYLRVNVDNTLGTSEARYDVHVDGQYVDTVVVPAGTSKSYDYLRASGTYTVELYEAHAYAVVAPELQGSIINEDTVVVDKAPVASDTLSIDRCAVLGEDDEKDPGQVSPAAASTTRVPQTLPATGATFDMLSTLPIAAGAITYLLMRRRLAPVRNQ